MIPTYTSDSATVSMHVAGGEAGHVGHRVAARRTAAAAAATNDPASSGLPRSEVSLRKTRRGVAAVMPLPAWRRSGEGTGPRRSARRGVRIRTQPARLRYEEANSGLPGNAFDRLYRARTRWLYVAAITDHERDAMRDVPGPRRSTSKWRRASTTDCRQRSRAGPPPTGRSGSARRASAPRSAHGRRGDGGRGGQAARSQHRARAAGRQADSHRGSRPSAFADACRWPAAWSSRRAAMGRRSWSASVWPRSPGARGSASRHSGTADRDRDGRPLPASRDRGPRHRTPCRLRTRRLSAAGRSDAPVSERARRGAALARPAFTVKRCRRRLARAAWEPNRTPARGGA